MNKYKLHKQIKDLEAELKHKETLYSNIQKECAQIKRHLETLKKHEGELKNTLGITDHALVRYLERVTKFDLDYVRREMLDRIKVRNLAVDGDYRITPKHVAVVKNGLVVTVKEKESPLHG